MSVDKVSSQPALHIIELTKSDGLIESKETNRVNESIVFKIPSKEEMSHVIEGINEVLKPINTHIKFELHEKLNEYYVTIFDNNTNEVVREIPSKKWLDIYAAMTDFVGLIVDQKI